MEDLGPPISYVVLEEGTPVYDKGEERVGVVEHVMADMQLDIFEGIVIHTRPLPGGHLFADVEQIAEMHERGVVLSVDRDELHEPPDESRRRDSRSEANAESPLEKRLRRAWDWIRERAR